MNSKIASLLILPALVFGGSAIVAEPAFAGGTVPPKVQKGIDDSIATIGALEGLALAALTVALLPLGAMLTLRFLNMVLSRV